MSATLANLESALKWDELSAEFLCPECGVGKDEYETL